MTSGLFAWQLFCIIRLRISDFLSLKCVEEIEKEPSRARQLISHLFNPKHKRTHRTVRCEFQSNYIIFKHDFLSSQIISSDIRRKDNFDNENTRKNRVYHQIFRNGNKNRILLDDTK